MVGIPVTPADVTAMREALFNEGVLDRYFLEIEDLGDDPNFIEDLMTVYFVDSNITLRTLDEILKAPMIDSRDLDCRIYLLKGSSASIGAKRVADLMALVKNLCQLGDIQGARSCLQDVKREIDVFRVKLGYYLELKKRVNLGTK